MAEVNLKSGESVQSIDESLLDFLKLSLADVDDILQRRGGSEYRKMKADGQVTLCLRLLKYATTSRSYKVAPLVNDPADPRYEQALAQARFIQDVFDNLEGVAFREVLMNAMDAVSFGYSVQELVWDTVQPLDEIYYNGARAQGLWKLKTVKPKDPETCSFKVDKFINVTDVVVTIGGVDTFYPPQKFLLFNYESEYSRPQGISLLRGAWKWWQAKVEVVQDLAVYLTKFASPTPRGRHPRNWSPEQQRALLKVLDGYRNQNALVIPDDADVDLLEANRSGDNIYISSLEYFDRQIAKSILGSFMQTDGNTKERGSLSLGELHFDIFLQSVFNARQRLQDAVRRQIIRPLCVANFPEPVVPNLYLGPIMDKDMNIMAVIFDRLIRAGNMRPDEPVIRQELGLPDIPEEWASEIANNYTVEKIVGKRKPISDSSGETV